MGRVITGFSMSLNGFIARPDDDVQRLFQCYFSGGTEIKFPTGKLVIHVSPASAQHIQDIHLKIGAIVTGWRMFNLMKGWGGRHPADVPVFVVTHAALPDAANWPSFTFVTDGVARAVARAQVVAGNRYVALDGASIAQQGLRAGLVDEVGVDLVPVLLTEGVRFFDQLGATPIELERTGVIAGTGVTHLRFRVVKEIDAQPGLVNTAFHP